MGHSHNSTALFILATLSGAEAQAVRPKLNEDLHTFIEKLDFYNLPKSSVTLCPAILLPSALINNLGFSLQVVRLMCTMLMFLLPCFLTSSVCQSPTPWGLLIYLKGEGIQGRERGGIVTPSLENRKQTKKEKAQGPAPTYWSCCSSAARIALQARSGQLPTWQINTETASIKEDPPSPMQCSHTCLILLLPTNPQ